MMTSLFWLQFITMIVIVGYVAVIILMEMCKE
jgi:hypothetical protein